MNTFPLWWQAVRPFSFPASMMPVVLGAVVAFLSPQEFRFSFIAFVLTFVGVVFLHCSGNLINDYFDHRKGIDTGAYGSHGLLSTGQMTPERVQKGIIVFLSTAFLIGIVLAFKGGLLVFAVGLFGALLAVLYTTAPFHLKYRGLGDLVIILAFGPLLVLGTYVVQTGSVSFKPMLLAIPLTFLVEAILHANNVRDIEIDRGKEITTLANLLGAKSARRFYDFLLLGAYLSVVFLVLFFDITPFAFLTFLTLPQAVKLHSLMKRQESVEAEKFAFVDAKTAQLHLSFSLVFTISLCLPTLIASLSSLVS